MSSDLKIAVESEDAGEKVYGDEIIAESTAKSTSMIKFQS